MCTYLGIDTGIDVGVQGGTMNWNASKRDYENASAIAKRALALAQEVEGTMSLQRASEFQRTTMMDIIATHANGCPLRLEELLTAERFDFSHDVFGIRRHIDRQTGKLQDCFLPRYAQ